MHLVKKITSNALLTLVAASSSGSEFQTAYLHGRRHGGSRVGKRPSWKKSGWAWPTPFDQNSSYCVLAWHGSMAGWAKSICKNSQQKRWKLPLSTTPLSFDAPPWRTSWNIRINLISPETRVIVLHFVADNVGPLSSFKFFVVGSGRRIFSATECV